jgi:hypothetical protein
MKRSFMIAENLRPENFAFDKDVDSEGDYVPKETPFLFEQLH